MIIFLAGMQHSPHLEVASTTNATNFTDVNNNNPGSFKTWDHVTFDNSSSGGTILIAAGGVSPSSVVFSSSRSYALTGGPLTGDAKLVLSGSGELLLANTGNTFSGGIEVDAGTLMVNNSGAFPPNTALSIGAGGKLIYDPAMHAGPVILLSVGNAILAPVTAVPEPGTFVLLAVGALLIGFRASRRRKNYN